MKLDHHNRYVTFKLLDTLMGINILEISEIVPDYKLTQVQQAPEFVAGLMNLRGRIFTVLDINVMLGLGNCHLDKDSHVILFKHQSVGFVVDRIGDVIGVAEDKIEPVPANIDPSMKSFMDHLIHLPEEIIMVLKGSKLRSFGNTAPSKETA